jgi:hypothetical protein
MGNHSQFVRALDDVNRCQVPPPGDRVFPLADDDDALTQLEAGEDVAKSSFELKRVSKSGIHHSTSWV